MTSGALLTAQYDFDVLVVCHEVHEPDHHCVAGADASSDHEFGVPCSCVTQAELHRWRFLRVHGILAHFKACPYLYRYMLSGAERSELL